MSYTPYSSMKESTVEWIGPVPSHWPVLMIKRLSLVKRGASPRPIDDPKYFDENGEYSWVRIADVTASERYLLSTTQKMSALGRSLSVSMQPGTLFLSIAGSVGKPIITKIKCCIHDGFVYFPYLREDREFLYYLFSTGRPYVGLGKLGTQLNLNTDTVGGISIPLPPLPEQKVIAAFLDRETQRIDALIAKKQKQLELLQRKRVALISQAVTKGLDPKVKMKASGVGWLGKIPEHWSLMPIKRISTYNNDSLSETTDPDFVMQYVDISSVDEVGGIKSSEPFIFEKAPSRARRLVRNGDVIVSTVRTYLKAIAGVQSPPSNLVVSTGFCVIRPLSLLSFSFARYLFKSTFVIAEIVSRSVGVSYPAINPSELVAIKIPLPPFQEQNAIAQHLDKEVSSMASLCSKIELSINKLSQYRSSLISAAVTGKIDVRKEVSIAD